MEAEDYTSKSRPAQERQDRSRKEEEKGEEKGEEESKESCETGGQHLTIVAWNVHRMGLGTFNKRKARKEN